MPLNLRLRRLLVAVLACAALLLPVAASAQDPSAEPSPEPAAVGPEGTWRVVAFDAWETGLVEPRSGSELTVSLLGGGQLEGETACGRFNGGWAIEDDVLYLGVAPTGNLGCGEKKAAEAIGLSAALGSVNSWRATDTGIELLDAAGTVRLALAGVGAIDPLGAWQVERYRKPNGDLTEPIADRPMYIAFEADGAVEGSTGCRLLLGDYDYEGTGITVGPLEAEGPPCDDAVRRAERQLLRALGEVVYWDRADDVLTLLDGFDTALVELRPEPEPEPTPADSLEPVETEE